jgi:hypothetical protein
MSNGLKNRIDRIQDTLTPQPPPRMIVFIVQRPTPIENPAGKRTMHVIGKYAECVLVGGTPREQRQALRRLRATGEYDRPPTYARPAIGEGGEEERDAPPKAIAGGGNGKAG